MSDIPSISPLFPYTTLFRSCDGRLLTVLLSSQPVEIGGTPHFMTAGVDITARKEAEAKLLERERQLRESEARMSTVRSEEHTSELQSQSNLVCRLLLEKKKK